MSCTVLVNSVKKELDLARTKYPVKFFFFLISFSGYDLYNA